MSVAWLERHQIVIYLGSLLAGAAVGLAAPAAAPWAELGIYPFLATLLYATFLQVPFTAIADSLRDARFLSAALVLNARPARTPRRSTTFWPVGPDESTEGPIASLYPFGGDAALCSRCA